MNKQTLIASALVWGLLGSGAAVAADEFATAKEAEAMVVKVVAAIKANKAGTFKEITDKDAKWVDRDLYPVVYDTTGKVLAHGQNPKMVDKDLIDFKDPEGKLYVKERVDLAKSKGKFWQDYAFTDPVTKKVLPKKAYCQLTGDMIVCAGIYTR
ncbi:cache domain-containing protein [Uliginosibacterium sp. H3]|uniref:Cache domain-containing protein n=1 Tax=Uliginosibacterium silvisoli TaxID=3114758 RepID=A0ABU6K392_9RHOO|nr:cache domain-containing protein [Uliginosibacterium sp. H3]